MPHAVHDPVRALRGEERVAADADDRDDAARNEEEQVSTLARVERLASVAALHLVYKGTNIQCTLYAYTHMYFFLYMEMYVKLILINRILYTLTQNHAMTPVANNAGARNVQRLNLKS